MGLDEVNIAMVGQDGVGKSALTVKFLTKRFISEYDEKLEETYCQHWRSDCEEAMVWLMDTAEGGLRRENSRWLSWADGVCVVYSITSSASFEAARTFLEALERHDHSFCPRPHLAFLLGNKSDLHRYRQVSKSQGSRLAQEFQAEFFELNATEEAALVDKVIDQVVSALLQLKRRPKVPPPLPIPLRVSPKPLHSSLHSSLPSSKKSSLSLFKLFNQ